MTDDNLQINDIVDVSDNMLLLTYHASTDFNPIGTNLSLIIAIFTTSHARTHLYNYLQKVPPEQLLYFDTGEFYSAPTISRF